MHTGSCGTVDLEAGGTVDDAGVAVGNVGVAVGNVGIAVDDGLSR